MPTKIKVTCPECGHEERIMVREKATNVCGSCSWPVDVREDGSVTTSPLVECRVEVHPAPLIDARLRTKHHVPIRGRGI